ncbi:unnamed protein product [Fusarium equiseti]|uniref:Uncharacterized protein n=1 Tax=Fusarium equiseti TaxID=61235 RepID=A0A8J2NGH3_FUSEQ|nr:unnamed protein product [Fusarium equiseti]
MGAAAIEEAKITQGKNLESKEAAIQSIPSTEYPSQHRSVARLVEPNPKASTQGSTCTTLRANPYPLGWMVTAMDTATSTNIQARNATTNN